MARQKNIIKRDLTVASLNEIIISTTDENLRAAYDRLYDLGGARETFAEYAARRTAFAARCVAFRDAVVALPKSATWARIRNTIEAAGATAEEAWRLTA